MLRVVAAASRASGSLSKKEVTSGDGCCSLGNSDAVFLAGTMTGWAVLWQSRFPGDWEAVKGRKEPASRTGARQGQMAFIADIKGKERPRRRQAAVSSQAMRRYQTAANFCDAHRRISALCPWTWVPSHAPVAAPPNHLIISLQSHFISFARCPSRAAAEQCRPPSPVSDCIAAQQKLSCARLWRFRVLLTKREFLGCLRTRTRLPLVATTCRAPLLVPIPAGTRPASPGRRLSSILLTRIWTSFLLNPPTSHFSSSHVAAGDATTSISHAPPRMPSVTSIADLCATCVAHALPLALSRSRIPIPNPPLRCTTRPTSWSLNSFGFRSSSSAITRAALLPLLHLICC